MITSKAGGISRRDGSRDREGVCEREREGEKGGCEREREGEKGGCEREREGEKGGCEREREGVKERGGGGEDGRV